MMNEVNKTLFIPLYGKARVSRAGLILHDPMAERIWQAEGFAVSGKAGSKWLAYNMAMRARVFDDWTRLMLSEHPRATVVHIGCGLDSRCCRVSQPRALWLDCDLPQVIAVREKYFRPEPRYCMQALDASSQSDLLSLPAASCAVVILEGLSMYLSPPQLADMLRLLSDKYADLHILLDVYTPFAAKASKYKNPVNEVGVSRLYGVKHMGQLLGECGLVVAKEHSFTPKALVDELSGLERGLFRLMFNAKLYRKIYRLYELRRAQA